MACGPWRVRGNCEICIRNGLCFAGYSNQEFVLASKEQLIERLDSGEYKNERTKQERIKSTLCEEYGYDYDTGDQYPLVVKPWSPQMLLDDLQKLIDEEPANYTNEKHTLLCTIRDCLMEYFAQQENPELTYDELKEMNGEPVWIVFDAVSEGGNPYGTWMLAYKDQKDEGIHFRDDMGYDFQYGHERILGVYRKKPKIFE